MATTSVLSWGNENALSSYPLLQDIDPQDFLVDAAFIQFDGFVPTLSRVVVDSSSISVTLELDFGSRSFILTKANADTGEAGSLLRLYTVGNSRYVGTLTFGPGVYKLWADYVGRTLTFNTKFDPSTVRSIPLADGVYSLDDVYGALTVSRASADSCVFYNVSDDNNTITFNAVGGHAVSGTPLGLRQINLVPPKNNNINLESNDVIKIKALNTSSLVVSLVAGKASPDFNVGTLGT